MDRDAFRRKLFLEFCKQTRQWGLYVSIPNDIDDYEEYLDVADFYDDILKAAPYLPDYRQVADVSIVSDDYVYAFGSESEILHLFNQTVGDDGPTALKPFNGPVRVYVAVCNPDGEWVEENT